MLIKLLSAASVAALTLFVSQPCIAAGATGVITVYHLNNTIQGRGSCIRMSPALPETGWACVWKHHDLYKELNDLFREGYFSGKTCSVSWSTNDIHGHHLVEIAQCQ
jgi:hypothetical protein